MACSGGCNLLGVVGLGVQGGITAVCAAAMLGVWLAESPRRPFQTWAMDVSKQVVGAAYGKCYNIAQAVVFAKLSHGDASRQDQCVWYLLGIATDCLLTTFLCWGASCLVRPVLLKRFGVDIGDYGEEVPVIPTPVRSRRRSHVESLGIDDDYRSLSGFSLGSLRSLSGTSVNGSTAAPSRVRKWLLQLFIWLLIITVVRLAVSTWLFFTQAAGYALCAFVFEVLTLRGANAKMLFAVLVFPAIGDTFQIVVQDGFLKKPPEVVDDDFLAVKAP